MTRNRNPHPNPVVRVVTFAPDPDTPPAVVPDVGVVTGFPAFDLPIFVVTAPAAASHNHRHRTVVTSGMADVGVSVIATVIPLIGDTGEHRAPYEAAECDPTFVSRMSRSRFDAEPENREDC